MKTILILSFLLVGCASTSPKVPAECFTIQNVTYNTNVHQTFKVNANVRLSLDGNGINPEIAKGALP